EQERLIAQAAEPVDADGNLTGEDFNTAWNERGGFADWDANQDQLLDEGELSEGLFSLFDANDDSFLDQTEWDLRSGVFTR
ncbi:MAG: hypothetical protein ACRELX_09140, partial [Longimicrobiales bacterium]